MRSLSVSVVSILVLAACGASGCSEGAGDDISADVQASVDTESLAPKVVLTSATNAWQWFDIPGALCGRGQQTGLGVSKGTGTDVVVWMAGGGMCFDEASCTFAAGEGLSLAQNIQSGFGAAQFNSPSWQSWMTTHGILNRGDATNPYRNATFVYVPYCTGDFHSGSTTQAWSGGQTMRFRGRQNLELFIPQITGSFPSASRVTVFGESAGAFGATVNFHRFKTAFGSKRVDLVADSGPWLFQIPAATKGAGAWNLAAAWPAGCTTCNTDYRTIYPYNSTTYPTSRFAYPIYDHDVIVTAGAMQNPVDFGNNLSAMQVGYQSSNANARFFSPASLAHVVTNDGMAIKSTATGQLLGTWLTQMYNDSPAWSNHASWGTSCTGFGQATGGIIEQKFIQLGGCGSVLGRPTTGVMQAPNGSIYGMFVKGTSNGAIYTDANGANPYEVHGPIKDYWANSAYEQGGYGLPKSDQLTTAVAGGAKNNFAGGAIFTHATHGTHGVYGAIWTKYASMGADASTLGLPKTEVNPTGFWNLDRRQDFQNGYIYWSAPSGAIAYLNP